MGETAPPSHPLNAYGSLRNQDIIQTGHYLDIDNLVIVNGVMSGPSVKRESGLGIGIAFNHTALSFQRVTKVISDRDRSLSGHTFPFTQMLNGFCNSVPFLTKVQLPSTEGMTAMSSVK
jgi:hypothetical protein